MECITAKELLSIIQQDDYLCKFFHEIEYAESMLFDGCLHISSCETFRKSETEDADIFEGCMLKSISIGNYALDADLNYYTTDKIVFVKKDDKLFKHDYVALNNYIYCMSHSSNPSFSLNDFCKCINKHGEYVVIMKLTDFIKQVINKKGKPCRLLAGAPVSYNDYERINIFTKSKEDAYEHEYRMVFDEGNTDVDSINIYVDSLESIARAYKVCIDSSCI